MADRIDRRTLNTNARQRHQTPPGSLPHRASGPSPAVAQVRERINSTQTAEVLVPIITFAENDHV
jgi:hypothetical protein